VIGSSRTKDAGNAPIISPLATPEWTWAACIESYGT